MGFKYLGLQVANGGSVEVYSEIQRELTVKKKDKEGRTYDMKERDVFFERITDPI